MLIFHRVSAILDLRWNNVGLIGGRQLISALDTNKTVVKLELAGNNTPEDILRSIGSLTFYLCLIKFWNMSGKDWCHDSAFLSVMDGYFAMLHWAVCGRSANNCPNYSKVYTRPGSVFTKILIVRIVLFLEFF